MIQPLQETDATVLEFDSDAEEIDEDVVTSMHRLAEEIIELCDEMEKEKHQLRILREIHAEKRRRLESLMAYTQTWKFSVSGRTFKRIDFLMEAN